MIDRINGNPSVQPVPLSQKTKKTAPDSPEKNAETSAPARVSKTAAPTVVHDPLTAAQAEETARKTRDDLADNQDVTLGLDQNLLNKEA